MFAGYRAQDGNPITKAMSITRLQVVILVMLFISIQLTGAVSATIKPFRMHGISMLNQSQTLHQLPLPRPTGHHRDMVPSASVQQVSQAEADLAPI